MGAKRVINGVHVVPMRMANVFQIECDDGLTLIDPGFRVRRPPSFRRFAGLAVRQASSLPMLYAAHCGSVSGNTC